MFLLVVAFWLESRRDLLPWKQPPSCNPSWTDLLLMCNSTAEALGNAVSDDEKELVATPDPAFPSAFGSYKEAGTGNNVFALGCVCVCGENGNLWSSVELEDGPAKCLDSESAEVSAQQTRYHNFSSGLGKKSPLKWMGVAMKGWKLKKVLYPMWFLTMAAAVRGAEEMMPGGQRFCVYVEHVWSTRVVVRERDGARGS